MVYQLTPWMVVNAVVFLLAAALGVYAAVRYVRLDHRAELLAFVFLMLAVSTWEFTNFAGDAVTAAGLKLLARNLNNALGVPLLIYSLLWFALAYTDGNDERWAPRLAVVCTVHVVIVSLGFALSPEFMYETGDLVTRGPTTVLGTTFDEWVVLERTPKPPFLLIQLYGYVITLLSGGILGRYLLRNRDDLSAGQAVALLFGIGTPLIVNALVFTGALPQALNPTDAAFGVTSVALAVAIFRYRLLRIVPVGRKQVVERMDDPVVMLDDRNRVVDSNPAARRLVGAETGWRGMTADRFFEPFADQVQQFTDEYDLATEIRITRDGTDRYFDLNISPIRAGTSEREGRLIVLREITDRKERERQLRQQNERLDQFASVVSHDLRNPLNSAKMRFSIVRDEVDDEDADVIESELDRMETMIDDLLGIARAGQEVEHSEPVALSDLAADCWETVPTDGAELDIRVPEEATVVADPGRLRQLLENLFRNSVEHGSTSSQQTGDAVDHTGPPLSVRVGLVDSGDDGSARAGFYVEDDGDGIPEGERESVLEHGYTTSEDGTGFGLSIVSNVAEAHGWDVEVCEGSDGGARFEITGIDTGDAVRQSP